MSDPTPHESLQRLNEVDYTDRTRRDHIVAILSDAAGNVMFYDRRECDSLPEGEIEKAIAAGEISYEEMGRIFAAACGGE